MRNVLQLHPKTLARLMTDQGHGGLPAYLDSLGFSDVRILANPNVPEDKMIVPSEWLDPKSTAIDDKD